MNTENQNPSSETPSSQGGVSNRLSKEELDMGYIIRSGQKTTLAIEQLCEESELASKATLFNQYF